MSGGAEHQRGSCWRADVSAGEQWGGRASHGEGLLLASHPARPRPVHGNVTAFRPRRRAAALAQRTGGVVRPAGAPRRAAYMAGWGRLGS
jgi:hypothetical protein